MVIKGISENFHDAAVAVMNDDKLLFASSSERFSRKKNDRFLCEELREIPADRHIFYEDWRLKNPREVLASFFKPRDLTNESSRAAASFFWSPSSSGRLTPRKKRPPCR